MKHFLIPSIFIATTLALCSSCRKEEDKSVNNYSAFFGGTANHEQSPYIVLYKEDEIIDTLKVDTNNTFGKRFDALMPGMYYFLKDDETGFVYFNKNDSIFLENTSDKLLYNGKGGAENMFLLELLRKIENESLNCDYLYTKSYKKFKISVDSLRDQQRAFYLRKKTELSWGKTFDLIAQNLIDYSYYKNLETYALKNTPQFVKDSLPITYFDYRKKVDFNNKNLVAFKPYIHYLMMALSNNGKNEYQTLKTADSIIKHPSLKNKVTYELAKKYVLENANNSYNIVYLNTFNTLNTNGIYKEKLNVLVQQLTQFKTQKVLPYTALINIDGDTITHFQSSKEQLFFFWSNSNLNHYKTQLQNIKFNINPNKTVVYAVNIDDFDTWTEKTPSDTIFVTHLKPLKFNELEEKWAITSLNRLILLNKNGSIKKHFATWNDFKRNK